MKLSIWHSRCLFLNLTFVVTTLISLQHNSCSAQPTTTAATTNNQRQIPKTAPNCTFFQQNRELTCRQWSPKEGLHLNASTANCCLFRRWSQCFKEILRFTSADFCYQELQSQVSTLEVNIRHYCKKDSPVDDQACLHFVQNQGAFSQNGAQQHLLLFGGNTFVYFLFFLFLYYLISPVFTHFL